MDENSELVYENVHVFILQTRCVNVTMAFYWKINTVPSPSSEYPGPADKYPSLKQSSDVNLLTMLLCSHSHTRGNDVSGSAKNLFQGITRIFF